MRNTLLVLSPLLLLAAASSGAQTNDKLSPALRAALAASGPGDVHLVWAYFTDKGPPSEAGLAAARAELTPRALSRRALRGDAPQLVGFDDLALPPAYVEGVFGHALRARQQSRWLNAVSAEATGEQVRAIAKLSFVERVDLVRRYRRPPEPRGEPEARAASTSDTEARHAFDYGTSISQLQLIKVPSVHDKGLHGEGIVIAVFDDGFNNLAHRAFASMRIAAHHDFVNGDEDVGDGSDMGTGAHGTETLSVLGGFKEGQLIGPAFAATYLLAKTENTDSETTQEEDNWAAAVEWAERRGADVISSSLGYLTFDSSNSSYSFGDMDGKTAISTRAAEKAASAGVVVVNAAGNNGFDAAHNTLSAPADGAHVLAVAAVSSGGSRAPFSSVGPSADGRVKPDVAALGISVKLASSSSTEGYVRADGTSYACPLAAGVAALVLQAHPSWNVNQVLAAIRSTARKANAPDRLIGYGIVNALAAVQAPAPPK